jgi:hypothetical protein
MAASGSTHKCAHPSCNCQVAQGTKFCSDYCKMAPAIDLRCDCKHAGCAG